MQGTGLLDRLGDVTGCEAGSTRGRSEMFAAVQLALDGACLM